MRYRIAFLFVFVFSLSIHAINNLPDELRLVQSFEIETQLLGTESQTVFALNGRIAASRNGENVVQIWDTVSGEVSVTIIGDPSGVFYWSAMALSADARFLALSIRSGIFIFDVETLQSLSQNGELQLEEDSIRAIRYALKTSEEDMRILQIGFSSDNSRFFALSVSQEILVWDISQTGAFDIYKMETWQHPLAWLEGNIRDAHQVAANSPINISADRVLFIAVAPVPSNRRDPRDYFLVTISHDLENETALWSNPFRRDALEYIQISADAQYILAFSIPQESIVIQTVATGETRSIISTTTEPAPRYLSASRAIMSADATTLAVVEDSGLRLFDIASGVELARTPADASEFLEISFINAQQIALAYPNRVLIYNWIRHD